MKHIRKNSGQIETFNSKKTLASVKKTFISNHYPKKAAEKHAKIVTSKIVAWLSKKNEVTYLDLRHQTAKQIALIDQNVAEMYKKLKDLW